MSRLEVTVSEPALPGRCSAFKRVERHQRQRLLFVGQQLSSQVDYPFVLLIGLMEERGVGRKEKQSRSIRRRRIETENQRLSRGPCQTLQQIQPTSKVWACWEDLHYCCTGRCNRDPWLVQNGILSSGPNLKVQHLIALAWDSSLANAGTALT